MENLVKINSSKFEKKKGIKYNEVINVNDQEKIKLHSMIQGKKNQALDDVEDEFELKNKNFYKTIKNIETKLSLKPNNKKQKISNKNSLKNQSNFNFDYSYTKRINSGVLANKFDDNIAINKLPNLNSIKNSTNRDLEYFIKTLEFKEVKIKTQIKDKEIKNMKNYLKNSMERDEKIVKIKEINREEEISRLQKLLKDYENRIKLNTEKSNHQNKTYISKFLQNKLLHKKKSDVSNIQNIKTLNILTDNKNMDNFDIEKNNIYQINKKSKEDNLFIENYVDKDMSVIHRNSDKTSFDNNNHDELNEYYIKRLNERIFEGIGYGENIDMDKFLINYKTTKTYNKNTYSPIPIRSIWNKKNSLTSEDNDTCKIGSSTEFINGKFKNKDTRYLVEPTTKKSNQNKGFKMNLLSNTKIPLRGIQDFDLKVYRSKNDYSIETFLNDLKREKNCEIFINKFKHSLDRILESKISDEKEKEKIRIEKVTRIKDSKEKKRIEIFNSEERLRATEEMIELNE